MSRLAIFAALLWLLFGAVPAFAHAQLLATEPAASALLAEPPAGLELQFNEPVTPVALTLISPGGARLDLTASAPPGATLRIALPQGLGQGTHLFSWRVISADAHPVAGSLPFSIGSASATAATAAADLAPALWAARWLLYVALALGIGGAVFARLAPLPPAALTAARLGAAASLVLAPVNLGLLGLDLTGEDLAAILASEPWSAALATTYGGTAMALAAASLLALGALLGLRPAALAWAALILAAIAFALSGHAALAEPQWLTRPAIALHVAGLLFWCGALLPLLLHLARPGPAATAALARFSRTIPFALAPLLLSGIVLAAVQLGPPGSAWLSPYGLLLAGKLAALALLLVLALCNRLRLTAPALAGDDHATGRLRLSLRAEILLVLVILALVSGWRLTPPPRALAASPSAAPTAEAGPAIHAMDETLMIMGTLSPQGPATGRLAFTLTDVDGAPIPADAITLRLSSPALGIEPMTIEAELQDDSWLAPHLALPLPGPWLIDFDIRLSRFELRTLSAEFDWP